MDYRRASECCRRAWRNRCPRCGVGRILKNLFVRHGCCKHCGLRYAREDGFFTAALPINYTLVCLLWVIPLMVLWMTDFFAWEWMVGLCAGGALLIPPLTYRYSQCLWLGAYYFFLANDIDSGKDVRESADE